MKDILGFACGFILTSVVIFGSVFLVIYLTDDTFFSSNSSSSSNSSYIGTENSPTIKISSKCIVEVEGCEYFIINADASYTYLHKGNCKNPIHIYNTNNTEKIISK